MPVDTPPSRLHRTASGIIRVGVLSDTHGYLNPMVLSVFKGVHRIVHTGDIESPEILTTLAKIAPLDSVRGNMDMGGWAAALPKEELIEVGDVTIYALHDLSHLSLDPDAAGIHVILSGHTHRPQARWQGHRLYLNPGSASLPRYGHAPSVAIVEIDGPDVNYRFIELKEA